MSKYTPGPWLCSHRPEAPTIHYIHEDDGSNYISPIEIASIFESGRNAEQQKANARLIAAAPELFESIAHAILYLESCGYDKAEEWDPQRQMLEDFRQVIAKAKGES